jgi:hypothetical protein
MNNEILELILKNDCENIFVLSKPSYSWMGKIIKYDNNYLTIDWYKEALGGTKQLIYKNKKYNYHSVSSSRTLGYLSKNNDYEFVKINPKEITYKDQIIFEGDEDIIKQIKKNKELISQLNEIGLKLI